MSDTLVIDGDRGTIAVTPAALAELVVRAVERAPETRVRRPRRGLEIDVDEGRARIGIELAVRYGVVVPDAARAVQERVAEALRRSCGLEATVDVAVEELDE